MSKKGLYTQKRLQKRPIHPKWDRQKRTTCPKKKCRRDLLTDKIARSWGLRYVEHVEERPVHPKRDLQKRPAKETYLLSRDKSVEPEVRPTYQKKASHPKRDVQKRPIFPQNTCKRQLLTIMREVRGPEERPSMSKTDLRQRPIHAYPQIDLGKRPTYPKVPKVTCKRDLQKRRTYLWTIYIYEYIYTYICIFTCMFTASNGERWGAGVETQQNVRGEVGGWGRVPFNEPYAPSLSTIYDGA